jgi:hypothetical protein
MIGDYGVGASVRENVILSLDEVGIEGDLSIPCDPVGIVLFVNATASTGVSAHRRMIIEELNRFNIATLSLDLLTPEEEENDGSKWRFDIDFLTRRVVEAARWLREYPDTQKLKLGLLGANTGAAAVLVAAAELPRQVRANVVYSGRTDLAGDALQKVEAPTLFIVGSADRENVELNRRASENLKCEHHTEKVPGATHTFLEEGTFERASELTRQWFDWYLTR